MKNIEIISIEGNIGSGKSTLLEHLKTHYSNNENVLFLKEPVDEWNNIKDEKGETILAKFYADQEKYSFTFQMMAYISRLKILKDAVNQIQKRKTYSSVNTDKKYVIITERSLYTDKMVFAKMLFDTGKMEYINHQIYLQWFDSFIEEFPVQKIIYVKTEPTICHNRIHIRNRNGENNIPLDYLTSCENYHEYMLNKNSAECVCHIQLILDGNNNIYEKNDILSNWISQIENFIK